MATASATLIDGGNGLIYDSELDVTGLKNANVAEVGMTWNDAIAWVDSFVYGGLDDWRLPNHQSLRKGSLTKASWDICIIRLSAILPSVLWKTLGRL